MKKLLLLSAVLVGAATASQAGISFNIGINLPTPRGVVISRPAARYEPAPVSLPCETPVPVCEPSPQVIIAPPVCEPAPVVVAPVYSPRVVVQPRPQIIVRNSTYQGFDNRDNRFEQHGRFDRDARSRVVSHGNSQHDDRFDRNDRHDYRR